MPRRVAAIDAQWGVRAKERQYRGRRRIAVAEPAAWRFIMAEAEPRVFVGVDWATQEHQVCALKADGVVVGERVFKHGGSGLEELAAWLSGLAPEREAVAVAIEVPHGPVVEALLERGFVVFAINPKQMDRFRDRFTVAGAKDDRFDARVLADSLRTDRACFRKLRVEDPLVIELREWSRMVDEMQAERVRLSNRIREQLWRYFPQMLDVTDDVAAEWFLELWQMVQTPQAAALMKPKRVEVLLRRHRIRRIDAPTIVKKLRDKPLTLAAGTVDAAAAHVANLVPRLQLLNAQHRAALRQLDMLTTKIAESAEGQKGEQRDVEILRSLPGVGRIVLATLLAEAHQPLHARDYHAIRTLCGIAPVTRRSGKSRVVAMRQACNARLRSAVYHWARCATQHETVSRAKYAELRRRGHSHGRAIRGVADRLLYVACAMLKAGAVFDPDRRTAAAA